MTIKRKLLFMLAIVSFILGALAGFFVWNTWRMSRQVRSVGPGVAFLHEAGGVRLRSYQQLHYFAHFLLFQEEEGKKRADAVGSEIEGAFPKMRDFIRIQASVGSENEEGELIYVDNIENAYKRLHAMLERAAAMKQSGKLSAAVAVMEEQAEPLLEDVFFFELGKSVSHEADEIAGNYDEIVLRMGVMPWRIEQSLREIRRSRLSIFYFLSADRLFGSLNRQFSEAVEYILFGGDGNRREFENAGREVQAALAECRKIINEQIGLDLEGEEEQRAGLDALEGEYRELVDMARGAIAMRTAGDKSKAVAVLERRLKPRVDKILYPKVDGILDGSMAEIAAVHNTLLESVVYAGAAGIAVVFVTCIVLFFFSLRFIRDMIRGIGTLREGTEIIGSGNLDHRIPEATNDELGGLARSFNKMTESLKEGDEDLRSFMFSLTHDLRSPLVNIKGFVGELRHTLQELEKLLEKNCRNLAEDDHRRLQALLGHDLPSTMAFIGNSAARINDLVNGVLKLSLIGRREFSPSAIDMTSLVRSVADRYGEEIGRNKTALRIGRLPPVAADRSDMEEIVASVLDNAFKYRAVGRTGEIEITGQRVAGESVYRFRDNGRGIAGEDLDKIFGLFRRAGQQDIPGDGLGLAYAKALVRRHRGRIWCESEPGVGTTFNVAIPDAKGLEDSR